MPISFLSRECISRVYTRRNKQGSNNSPSEGAMSDEAASFDVPATLPIDCLGERCHNAYMGLW
jgi:hypothetical protein